MTGDDHSHFAAYRFHHFPNARSNFGLDGENIRTSEHLSDFVEETRGRRGLLRFPVGVSLASQRLRSR